MTFVNSGLCFALIVLVFLTSLFFASNKKVSYIQQNKHAGKQCKTCDQQIVVNSILFFFICRPTFFNDCKKIGQFGYIV